MDIKVEEQSISAWSQAFADRTPISPFGDGEWYLVTYYSRNQGVEGGCYTLYQFQLVTEEMDIEDRSDLTSCDEPTYEAAPEEPGVCLEERQRVEMELWVTAVRDQSRILIGDNPTEMADSLLAKFRETFPQ